MNCQNTHATPDHAVLRCTLGTAGGFEERGSGARYNLAVPVQLNDGIGIMRDISTSGMLLETETRTRLEKMRIS